MATGTKATVKAKASSKTAKPMPVATVAKLKPVVAAAKPAKSVAAPAPKEVLIKTPAPVQAVRTKIVPAIKAVVEKTVEAAEVSTETLTKTIIETKAAPTTVPVATKEASIMVEQFKAAAQTAFTQGSDKARETLEKTVKSFEEAGEFAKGNVEALVASGKAVTAGAETMVQSATDFSKKSFEASSAHMQTLAATRTPTDIFKLQSDFAKSQFDGLVAEMSRSTEVMMKIMGDVFEPISNRVALAAEKAKSVVAVAR